MFFFYFTLELSHMHRVLNFRSSKTGRLLTNLWFYGLQKTGMVNRFVSPFSFCHKAFSLQSVKKKRSNGTNDANLMPYDSSLEPRQALPHWPLPPGCSSFFRSCFSFFLFWICSIILLNQIWIFDIFCLFGNLRKLKKLLALTNGFVYYLRKQGQAPNLLIQSGLLQTRLGILKFYTESWVLFSPL